MTIPRPGPSMLMQALRRARGHLAAAAAFSASVNLLNLVPTIYTMQVYDRVLPTGHLPTLAAVTAVTLAALAVLTVFDWLRARVLIRTGARLDAILGRTLLVALMSRPGLSRLDRAEGMRQLDTVRQGIAGPVTSAVFDLPWAPLYVLVAFMLHPALGGLALGGCVLLLALAWSNERAVGRPVGAAEHAAAQANAGYAYVSAYAAEVRAMGMRDALAERTLRERGEAQRAQLAAGFTSVGHSGLVRFCRMALQTAATGVGAWLAVSGAISPGAVIASSFLFARAMAPIDQIVAGWRGIVAVRNAARRIDAVLADSPSREHVRLPRPTGVVAAERLTVLAPLSDRVALAEASFVVAPGEQIGVVGPSGAGKSTLLRALAGALEPVRGTVRYDGVAYADWYPDQIADAIGYLPQEFMLFPGTVRDNISRFAIERGVAADEIDAKVIAAAAAIGLHETVARLPEGYGTRIGTGGIGLSAGQTQRIALARALYGDPAVLILDEPNAHLDSEAEHQLVRLFSRLRARGTTVIMAAHSGDVLASMDKLLHLRAGTVAGFQPLSPAPAVQPTSYRIEKDA